jgi:hypothetical protein
MSNALRCAYGCEEHDETVLTNLLLNLTGAGEECNSIPSLPCPSHHPSSYQSAIDYGKLADEAERYLKHQAPMLIRWLKNFCCHRNVECDGNPTVVL